MVEHLHRGLSLNEREQPSVSRLDQLPVGPRRHERGVLPAQVICLYHNIDQVPDLSQGPFPEGALELKEVNLEDIEETVYSYQGVCE